jgi:hypothetical protein
MECLLEAAKKGRVRDHLLLLMTGLRLSEAIGLRRDQLNLQRARLWVTRLKGSLSVEHPIDGEELRAIKRYLSTREDSLPWLFVNERLQPLTRQSVNYLIREPASALGWDASSHICSGARTLLVKQGGYLRARSSCGAIPVEMVWSMRVRPRRRWRRLAHRAGLSRPPRPETHCPAYSSCRPSIRGDLEMSAPGTSVSNATSSSATVTARANSRDLLRPRMS